MNEERTPLLTTVRLRPVRRRYRNNVCRRFCTIALGSILVGFLITIVLTAFFDLDYRLGPNHPWLTSPRGNITEEELKKLMISTPSRHKAAQWSKHYTAGPHLAGTAYPLVEWTREKWEEFGIKSHIVTYDVHLNYPVDHRLAMLRGDKIVYEAPLAEDVIEEDATTGLDDRIPTFHGYSASGNATAPFVYVNYGTYQDYEDLRNANVTLEGKIAIARYGYVFRGLKVKRAQELGMVGVVIYSDPGDDGEVTDENGFAQYPDGPARQPSSVQRGSVQWLSVAPGDPTTPGYPSKPGVPRLPTKDILPGIPSIPISYREAIPILKALEGHGPVSTDFNKYWTANEGLRYQGVSYNIGPTPDNVILNLYNHQDYITTPLWNVIGVINGSMPDEVVIVGNHRDAWIAGGAGDPNSGSAILMEVVRSFGEALRAGWKPLRTIVFASWDGEEYSLIGSTEWVEEYLPWLSTSAVSYLNVDIGTRGTDFSAAAAPLLNQVLREATAMVPSPNQTVPGQTVAEFWDGRIRTMGSGSDFTAFQDFAGVPSIDMGFGSGPKDPVYHYHSNYDSFHWMDKFGDPGFRYHKAMSQLLGVLTATLAGRPLITMSATEYADALSSYVDKIKAMLDAADHGVDILDFTSAKTDEEKSTLRASTQSTKDLESAAANSKALRSALEILQKSINQLRVKAVRLDARAAKLSDKLAEANIPWWKFWEWIRLMMAVRKTNTQYKHLERKFLYRKGLDGRKWFKHVVFAPGRWTGYAGGEF